MNLHSCARVLALLLLSLWPVAKAFSNGKVFAACNTMFPMHPLTFGPHWSVAPYTVAATQNPDGSVDVTINAEVPEAMFRGFLLQARNSSNMNVGTFVAVPPTAQTLACGYSGSAVSHNSNEGKSLITALWQPDGHRGDVTFRATIVRNYLSYWTQIMSPTYVI